MIIFKYPVWWAAVHGVAKSRTRVSDFTFTFHFDALEREMATHSIILAWRILWTAEPERFQTMGLQRAGYNWLTNPSLLDGLTLWETPYIRYCPLKMHYSQCLPNMLLLKAKWLHTTPQLLLPIWVAHLSGQKVILLTHCEIISLLIVLTWLHFQKMYQQHCTSENINHKILSRDCLEQSNILCLKENEKW